MMLMYFSAFLTASINPVDLSRAVFGSKKHRQHITTVITFQLHLSERKQSLEADIDGGKDNSCYFNDTHL